VVFTTDTTIMTMMTTITTPMMMRICRYGGLRNEGREEDVNTPSYLSTWCGEKREKG